MPISVAGSATIEGYPNRTLGHPSYVQTSSNNCSAKVDSIWAYHWAGDYGGWLYTQSGEVFGHTANRIKSRLDATGGQSGSPIFYCPYANGCAEGNNAYITGVLAYYVNPIGGAAYVGGPRASAFRGWVEGIIP